MDTWRWGVDVARYSKTHQTPAQPGQAPVQTLSAGELVRDAVEHYRAGRPNDVLLCCDQALLADSTSVAAHVYRSLALRRIGRFGDAIRGFQHAVLLEPNNAATHEQLGLALLDLNRIDEALAAFRSALELDENRLIALVNIGNIEMWRHNLDVSEAAYRRALALNPNLTICYQNLCWLLRRLGRFDDAVVAGRRAVELNPRNLTPYNYLTFALLAADDCAAAIEVCDASLLLDGRNTSALAYKPSALAGMGRLDEGRELVDLERLVHCGNITSMAHIPDLHGFNSALASYVQTCPIRPHDDTQTVDLLGDPKGPVILLKSLIDQAVSRYIGQLPIDAEHPFLAFKPRHWKLDGWATLLTSMAVQEHHFHQHGWISGVYYLKVPDFIGTPDAGNAGFIEFCRFPQFSTRPASTEFATFAPFEGMLILFPSYFYHRVVEFPDSEKRISFAFNVTLTA